MWTSNIMRNLMHSLLVTTLLISFEAAHIPWPPKWAFFTQMVDHFNFPSSNITYQMRYLYEDQWFNPAGGPIFFYCGNEGSIESFWNNSGYIFDLAKQMNALVVFGEHRYYGKSLPFPTPFRQPYIQFLSVSQALADFAYLLKTVKMKFATPRTPVIAFGGSYGGMLAAYMRVKYPHIVSGAISSSAPVLLVAGIGRFHQFFESVTYDYKTANPQCESRIRSAYKVLGDIARVPSKWNNLSIQLNLCTPIRTSADFQWMLKWTRNAFVMMAMMDYPYKTSFMASLPAYPVNVSCERALAISDPVIGLREAIAVIYNSSAKLSCFDYKTQYIECADITGCGLGNDSLAWDFQSCTEMNLYDPSGATQDDMFPSLPLTRQAVSNYCSCKWGVTPAFDQLATFFGPEVWKSASNIVFVNGDLDPWMSGGVLEDQSPTVRSIVLHGGAHHLDLRSPHPNDPPSARMVREFEARTIETWLKQEC